MMRTQAVSAVLLAVIIDGCSHCYYVSNVQHVPLFQEQGEVQFAVSYSEGEDITKSFGGQVAGSLTNHLGLMGSFFYTTGGDASESNCGNGYLLDAAAGYFKPIKKHAVFEIYGGAGFCNQHHTFSLSYPYQQTTSASLNYGKCFLQPSFGVTTKYLDVAVSTRLSRVDFYGMSGTLDETLNYLSKNNLYYFEPAVVLRFGFENVKIQAQFIYSDLLNNADYYINEDFQLSLGLHFSLNTKQKSVQGEFK